MSSNRDTAMGRVVALTVSIAFLSTVVQQPASAGAGALALSDVVVSEIMYHPPDVGQIVGDEFEFIELKNVGTEIVDLGGVSFADGIEYTFPAGTSIAPGGFVVLASNPAQFAAKYGFQPAGAYTGALNNAGERVALSQPGGAVFFEVTYADDAPWPGAADGGGFSIVPVDPFSNPDPNDPANWRASSAIGGSPGEDDAAVSIAPVYVNELLAHTDPPQQDAVELHNPNDETVNIGGWYLTDDADEPRKYRFPAGTTIPPGGFLIVDEEDFNPSPGVDPSFGFSAVGDEVYLFSADETGTLTGYRHGYSFAASENQVSFGRHVNSVGAEMFVRQRASSFGQENVGPRPSPVVISEIMYHPLEGSDEFLEITNISNGLIPLYDPLVPQNTWQIDGLMYTLPQGIELAAGEVLLVVGIDPATFRTKYGIPGDVQIVGPYIGLLSNAGERLELEEPDPPNQDGEVPYIEVDAVTYTDESPWPPQADGGGRSLQRTNLEVYADDPIYWQASPVVGGTPGDRSLTASEEPVTEMIHAFELSAAYPNPFNPSTTLSFSVRASQPVRAELYDALGRMQSVLFDSRAVAGASYVVTVDAAALPSGTYFVRLLGQSFTATRTITLMK